MAETDDESRQAERDALRLLSRREYSAEELRQKLRAKSHDSELIESLLQNLQRQNLQSDERFTEAYIRFRQSKGFGPVRIGHELQQKGVPQTLIDQGLNNSEISWDEAIRDVHRKRFGDQLPSTAEERVKQGRFLQYRGFSSQQVHWLLSGKALEFA